MSLWTDFVKEFAAKNNLTYKQAMSDPRCSALYKEAKAGADKKEAKAKELYEKYAPIVNAPPEPEPEEPDEEEVGRLIAEAKPKAKVQKMKRLTDIVKKKYDGRVYYANRFLDYVDAYGIVDGKVMKIGEVGDYNSLDLFDTPKSIPSNVRFYDDNFPKKPIKILNDLMD